MKKTWALLAGHGGVINGIYQTAPKKMFQHSPEEIFYEGVSNRIIKDGIIRLGWDKGLHIIDLCSTELDVPLDVRADIANRYYEEYPDLVGIEIHSNAGGGSGFEVFTSLGETESDKYATVWGHEIMAMFDIAFRPDYVDGDLDKENHLYMTRKTNCPWILTENLFFDNYDDYLKLSDPLFRKRLIKAFVNFMEKAELVL